VTSPNASSQARDHWNARLLAVPNGPLLGLTPEQQDEISLFRSALESNPSASNDHTTCDCGHELVVLATSECHGLPVRTGFCPVSGLVQSIDRIDAGRQLLVLSPRAHSSPLLDALVAQAGLVAYVGLGDTEAIDRQSAVRIRGFASASDLNDSYDLILLDDVLGRTADLGPILRTLKQHLTQEGRLYIRCPGLFMLHRRPDIWFDFLRFRHVGRQYEFELGSLVRVMRQHGWRLELGNESLEAVFRNEPHPLPTTARGSQLTTYLAFVERERLFWTDQEIERQHQASEIQALTRELKDQRAHSAWLAAKLERMTRSNSWRMTTPFRLAESIFGKAD
jgi:hypothetical protein